MCASQVKALSRIQRIHERVYNELAQTYENRINADIDTFLVDSVLKHLDKRFKAPIKVIEVGPGVGSVLKLFEERKHRTLGVELCEKMAELTAKRSPNSFIIQSDFLALKFPSESFHIVYAGALIHLFPKAWALKILAKFRHMLKEDGLLFVNTTIHERPSEGFAEKYDCEEHPRRFRKQWTEIELREAVEGNDFIILESLYRETGSKRWLGLICKAEKSHAR